MRRKSIALTSTLRSFLISSPQLTPKKGVTAVLKNATRVHDVVVWKNNKVTNFFQTLRDHFYCKLKFRLKRSLDIEWLKSDEQMLFVAWVRKEIWTRDYRIRMVVKIPLLFIKRDYGQVAFHCLFLIFVSFMSRILLSHATLLTNAPWALTFVPLAFHNRL